MGYTAPYLGFARCSGIHHARFRALPLDTPCKDLGVLPGGLGIGSSSEIHQPYLGSARTLVFHHARTLWFLLGASGMGHPVGYTTPQCPLINRLIMAIRSCLLDCAQWIVRIGFGSCLLDQSASQPSQPASSQPACQPAASQQPASQPTSQPASQPKIGRAGAAAD